MALIFKPSDIFSLFKKRTQIPERLSTSFDAACGYVEAFPVPSDIVVCSEWFMNVRLTGHSDMRLEDCWARGKRKRKH